MISSLTASSATTLNPAATLNPATLSPAGAVPEKLAAPQLNQPQLVQQKDNEELRSTFDKFVGQTFFSQMLSSMRKTVGKPAYFHGGRAEEVFQGQLDQTLSESLSAATSGSFSGPMYDLFTLSRK